MAAKKRVPLGANFRDPIPQQGRQTTSSRAVHRINNRLETALLQSMAQGGGIDGATQAVQILGPAVKTLGLTGFRDRDATCGQTALHPLGEVPFHRPPEMAFDLEAKPFRRVMAGGGH